MRPRTWCRRAPSSKTDMLLIRTIRKHSPTQPRSPSLMTSVTQPLPLCTLSRHRRHRLTIQRTSMTLAWSSMTPSSILILSVLLMMPATRSSLTVLVSRQQQFLMTTTSSKVRARRYTSLMTCRRWFHPNLHRSAVNRQASTLARKATSSLKSSQIRCSSRQHAKPATLAVTSIGVKISSWSMSMTQTSLSALTSIQVFTTLTSLRLR